MAIVLCKIKNPKPATQGWVGVLPGGKARRYMCRHRMAGPVGHIVICTDTAKHPAQASEDKDDPQLPKHKIHRYILSWSWL